MRYRKRHRHGITVPQFLDLEIGKPFHTQHIDTVPQFLGLKIGKSFYIQQIQHIVALDAVVVSCIVTDG